MTSYPPMTRHHFGMTLMSILAFAIMGLVLSFTVVLLMNGAWIIVYIFWPILLIQLAFSLLFELIRELFVSSASAAKQDNAKEQEAEQQPWLRTKSHWIGLVIGVTWTAVLEIMN